MNPIKNQTLNFKGSKAPFIKPDLTVEELTKALYHANINLDKINKDLIKSQEEKAILLTNISHDLRSPITAIRTSVEYLLSLENFDSKEIFKVLELICTRADILDHLINDIFLLSSMSSSDVNLHLETVNMGIFLESFFYSCEADKKYSKRNLILDVPEDFSFEVSIDCKLMERVLDNLFSNALKYSQDNSSITLSAASLKSEIVLVSVKDNGIGICKEDLDKIFHRTYMVSKSRTPGRNSSCGLGLSIAKTIVEHHGGTIWCESNPGYGSVFHFTIPIQQ